VIEVTVKDGWYVITASKMTLVLSRRQFIEALKAGKAWRRRESFKARTAGPQDRPVGTHDR
jgi:hypothetical protein